MVRTSTSNSTKATNSVVSARQSGVSKPRKGNGKGSPTRHSLEIEVKNEEDEPDTDGDKDEHDTVINGPSEKKGRGEEDSKKKKKSAPVKKSSPPSSSADTSIVNVAMEDKADKTEGEEDKAWAKEFADACLLFSSAVKKGFDVGDDKAQNDLRHAYDAFYFPPPSLSSGKVLKIHHEDIQFFFVRVHPTTRSRCLFGRLVNGEKEPFFRENLTLNPPANYFDRSLPASGNKIKKM